MEEESMVISRRFSVDEQNKVLGVLMELKNKSHALGHRLGHWQSGTWNNSLSAIATNALTTDGVKNVCSRCKKSIYFAKDKVTRGGADLLVDRCK